MLGTTATVTVCYNQRMPVDIERLTEEELYEPVRQYISRRLNAYPARYHLEITSHGRFSETLKRLIPEDIVFSFLRTEFPDLTGFILRKNIEIRAATCKHVRSFIVVEVKTGRLTLEDVYQAKRYGDLFKAEFALLVSLEPIREEIKRLHEQISVLNRFQGSRIIRYKVKKKKHEKWKIDSWKIRLGQAFIKDTNDLPLEIEDIIWYLGDPF